MRIVRFDWSATVHVPDEWPKDDAQYSAARLEAFKALKEDDGEVAYAGPPLSTLGDDL